MLEFSDAPYCFFEARPSPPLIRLGRECNRRLFLPGRNHRIPEVVISGETEAMRDAASDGGGLMFVINHPSHSDAQVLTEVHRRLGVDSCYMAAYDVFIRSRFCAFCMQRMGNFSIDREGSDRKAMAAAIQVLKDGERALNIFPEGNVFLTNDRLMPFMDGAAFIALKAQAALGEVPVRIIPVSLKLTHLTIPRETVSNRMRELAQRSGYAFPDGSADDPVSAVMGLGRHIVGDYLRTHGHAEEIGNDESALFETLGTFAASLVTGLEEALELSSPEAAKLSDRIGKIRSRLHQRRTDTSSPPDSSLDGLADRAILAMRIHGYLFPYLTAHPTIDRYDETVERIAEDFYSRAMPRTGPRRAMVQIHAPLEVKDFLSAADGNMRKAISSLTGKMQTTVQDGINALNTANGTPGTTLLT